MIAPAERYEILVNFADGRAIDLITPPDPHHGTGPGMMMQIGRRPADEMQHVLQFKPDPDLQAAVDRPRLALQNLACVSRIDRETLVELPESLRIDEGAQSSASLALPRCVD